MERLNSRYHREALAFIRDLYAVRDIDRFIEFAVTRLADLMHSELTSYIEVQVEQGRSKNFVIPSQPPKRDEAWEHVMHQHPGIAHFRRMPDGITQRLSDFFSPRRFHNMALYCEHYRPLGSIEDGLNVVFMGSNGTLNAIGGHRVRRFSDRDVALMDFIRPHLVQAHGNAVAVSAITKRAVRLAGALEAAARGVVILRADRTVEFVTALGRWLMEKYFGAAPLGERLPEALDLWVRATAPRLAGRMPAREPMVVGRANTRLTVRLLAARHGSVVLLEERDTVIDAESIASLGLTRRESEVLALVANGRSKSEIARMLGTSPRTVDKHLQNIYDTLGVPNRTAAAAMAFRAARGLDHGVDGQSRRELHAHLNGAVARNGGAYPAAPGEPSA